MVFNKKEEVTFVIEFHVSPWVGHEGRWATITKLKGKHKWWSRIYKDVAYFVETCESYKVYSNVRQKDELHDSTYPLSYISNGWWSWYHC